MTSPALARSIGGGRMYHWDGQDYPSVTTILGATLPKPALAPWAAKKVAEYAIAHRGAVTALLEAGDERAAIDLLKGAPWRDRDRAGEVGTAVHAYAETVANGIEPVALDPAVAPFIPHFARFIEDWQPEYIETEATVFSYLGYACDRFAVLHLRPNGYRLVPMTVDFEQVRMWRRLVESYAYLRGPHTKAVLPDMRKESAA